MVNDEVKSNVDEVHLLYDLVELSALKHLKCIAVNVKNFIGFDLGMAALD